MGNDKPDLQTSARLFARAQARAGGPERLAQLLGVKTTELALWAGGRTFPPQPIFERVLEVVLGVEGALTDARADGTPASRKPRALVADSENGVALLAKILGEEFDLVPVHEMSDALDIAQASVHAIDVIICGQQFAGSQMLDLLACMKAYAPTRDVPFVCYRLEDTKLNPAVLRGTREACEALGALAYIDLPEFRERVGGEVAAVQFRAAVRAAAGFARGAARQRVLVVDDNADAAHTLTMLIQMAGHEVHKAANGAEALRVAADVRPTVVILDLGMPGMSGYEVARTMRAAEWGAAPVLIAVTGHASAQDVQQALSAGFDRHFAKPVAPETLLDAFPRQPATPAQN